MPFRVSVSNGTSKRSSLLAPQSDVITANGVRLASEVSRRNRATILTFFEEYSITSHHISSTPLLLLPSRASFTCFVFAPPFVDVGITRMKHTIKSEFLKFNITSINSRPLYMSLNCMAAWASASVQLDLRRCTSVSFRHSPGGGLCPPPGRTVGPSRGNVTKNFSEALL
jgi:hypothetical protein